MTAVRIVEVGPRDGLQNEPGVVPTATKLERIRRLAATGLKHIGGRTVPVVEATHRHDLGSHEVSRAKRAAS